MEITSIVMVSISERLVQTSEVEIAPIKAWYLTLIVKESIWLFLKKNQKMQEVIPPCFAFPDLIAYTVNMGFILAVIFMPIILRL